MTERGDIANLSPGVRAAEPARGRMVDIGGRRLHLVCEGPRGAVPTVVFEAGAFGTSADWAVVQDRVADRMHACAYDRAGLGLSDAGPEPRDSRAVAADLKALLEASGEHGPFILVAHSMAPVHAYLFALQNPELVSGLVLVDGTPPEAMTDPKIAGMVKSFGVAAALAPLAARLGLLWAADPLAGDPIGVGGQAAADKRRAFSSARHNHWGAVEAKDWLRDGQEARDAGELSRELPVAVISATGDTHLRTALEAPARRSRRGYVEHVAGANHATLLGPKFADAVVRGIEFVKRAAVEGGEPASVFAPSSAPSSAPIAARTPELAPAA